LGIKLTINGRQIEAKPGQKVLEAAKEHGIKIPHLCYHGQIGSIGSCRICLVEVKPGPPKPVPACTTTVAEGMEVQTHSERVINLRKELVSLLLINHPLDCPVCDQAGECKLQKIVHELGIEAPKYRATPTRSEVDYASPLIERHPERCIHCGRCVTICERVIGAEGIFFANRGYDMEVASGGRPLDCEFCGSCVAVCPVGALIDKTFKYRARSWELVKHETTCPYCAAGCRIELNVSGNSVRRVTSNHKKTFNRGLLCGRGRFGHGFIGSGERLKTPLIREGAHLRAATWEEAIKAAADGLRGVQREHGGKAVYALGSPRVSSEADYLLQRLIRTEFGTNNIDTQARFGYLPALLILAEAFGAPKVAGGKFLGFAARCGTLAELAASDAVFIIGADVRPELPSAALAVIAAAGKGANVCVANMRRTKLDRFATASLRYSPGAEVGLLRALAKALLATTESQAEGLAALRSALEGRQFGELLQQTGATEAEIVALAATLTSASRPAVVFGADLFNTGGAAHKVRALADVALLLKDEARLYPLAPKANSRGAIEAGCCPEWLPGYATPKEAAPFEKKWGVKLAGRPQVGFPEAVAAGGIKALYCLGANPLRGWPNTPAIDEALGRLDFLVVQDIFLTEAAERANVVLPAASYAAGEGSFTNSEGRRGMLARAVEEGLPPDWEVVARLSAALEAPTGFKSAADVRAEMAALSPLLAASFEELQGLPRDLSGAKFSAGEMPEAAGGEGTHLLVAGSLFHSGTLSTRAEGPLSVEAQGCVLVSPEDARALGLESEVALEVEGRSLVAPCRVSPDLPPGLVVASDHFAGLPAHRLTTASHLTRVKLSRPGEGS
jgi:formate dehydrogenase alpha subunit